MGLVQESELDFDMLSDERHRNSSVDEWLRRLDDGARMQGHLIFSQH